MNFTLILTSITFVQAREVNHYIAVCETGKVMMACTQPFCDNTTAKYKAQKVCTNQMGLSKLVLLQGQHNAKEALISQVEKAEKAEEALKEEEARKAEESLKEEARLREEARKAEEARLREKVRKAEETRKAEEARQIAECRKQLTYTPPIWACPHGGYVSNPNECSQLEGMTLSASYAVHVDPGLRVLPPGVSCILWEGEAAATHEYLLDFVLGMVNFFYNEKFNGREIPPEDFDFDVMAPVNQAFAAWRKAEDRRLAAIPYDCLAGVCLNTPATHIADKLVTVSEVVMHRKVEVCSGRVVSVEVSAGWVLPTFEFATIATAAEIETYGDGMEIYSTAHAEQIARELETMGWVSVVERDFPDYYSQKVYENPAKKGWRDIMRVQGDDLYSWRVDLKTTHPDEDALCAPKRQQGL
jgi:hypothetical protein